MLTKLTFILVALLVVASFTFVARQTRAYTSPCCEYGVYSTDIQPKPGERVDLTGVVTDRFGGGQAGVQVEYTDGGNYATTPLNTTTNENGAWHLSVEMPSANIQYPMRFIIAMNDSTLEWASSIIDHYDYVSSSGDVPGIYESEYSGRLNAYLNIQSVGFPAVIFLGGGYVQPILTGDSQLDPDTMSFLAGIASSGYNVIAPIGWFVPTQPVFPYVLAALIKYGLGISRVYLMGWSAGGTVAAWTIVNDNYHLFDLVVIMDAELQGADASTQTDPAVFQTAQLSGQVQVPNLLIWGINDSGASSIQSASVWASNAQRDFVRLDSFGYTHEWIGMPVQYQIQEDIIGFFRAGFVGTYTSLQSGNTAIQFLTNSQIDVHDTAFNSSSKSFMIQVTQANGTIGSLNVVLPKTSVDGQLVVIVDNATVNAPSLADSKNYYVYLTYANGRHVIVIAGQGTVPEFPDRIHRLGILVMMLSLVVILSRFNRAQRRPKLKLTSNKNR